MSEKLSTEASSLIARSCYPDKITEVEEFVAALEADQALLQEQQETADARHCPCRLHFKVAFPANLKEQSDE